MQELVLKKCSQGGGSTHIKKIRPLHVRTQKLLKKLTLLENTLPRCSVVKIANHKGTEIGRVHTSVECVMR